MRYAPAPQPFNSGDVPRYVQDELRRIADCMGTELRLPILAKEPSNAANGMIVYADGATWNPGAGAGFYGRQAGAWVKL
jgi:hypothetical protein